MFFSWYFKNRHFKKRSNLSGQIAPFLLVVLVILLAAAIATINIGRVGIDKTYTNNAADAGALASASAMAGLFNWLCEANNGLKGSYDTFYDASYWALYCQADDDLNSAINYTVEAAALVLATTIYAQTLNMRECDGKFPWDYLLEAALATAAAYLCYQAMEKTNDFSADISALISLVDNFHSNQYEAYCDIRSSADESAAAAGETGYSLAFSNSGISQKLTDSQQSDFSSFMTGPSGSFSWQDKTGGGHTVSVNVDVPKVENYILQHTNYSYSKVMDILKQIKDDSQSVATILYTESIMLALEAAIWIATAIVSIIFWVFYILCETGVPYITVWACPAKQVTCAVQKVLEELASGYTSWIGLVLGLLLVAGAGWGALNLWSLYAENDDAYDGVGPDGNQGSTDCGDAADLLIVKFDSVPYPGDVIVTSSQQHPGTSSGIIPTSYPLVSSSASASYDGGDVGSYDASYDSKLTGAS